MILKIRLYLFHYVGDKASNIHKSLIQKLVNYKYTTTNQALDMYFFYSQIFSSCVLEKDFPHSSVVKNPSASAGDVASIPELGRSPGEGKGNPLQYSFLGNTMDTGDWWATVHGVAKS